MKNKKSLKWLLIVVPLFLLISVTATVCVTGYIIFNNVTRLSTNESTSMENSFSFYEQLKFDYDEFEQSYNIEKINITSTYDGHNIPGDLIYSENKDAETIVMIHGLGGNRYGLLPVAEMFLEEGYNVLVYDQRSAGENTAEYTTFGYLESYDAADCVDYLDGILSSNQKIFIWGCSNGAATAGISVHHEAVKNRVTSIILDCPVVGAQEMMRAEMETMNIGLPLDFVMFCGDLYNRLKLGFSYAEASAVPYLSESDFPVLIVASKADEITPFWMAERLKEVSKNATLISVEDSKHADIFFDYPEWYMEEMLKFLK